MDKGEKHHVQLLESGEDSAKALESAKESLDLVAATIHGTIVLPGGHSVRFRRDDRDIPQIEGQLTGFIPFVGPIHEQVNRPGGGSECLQEFASLRGIVGLTGRQGKRYGRSSIRGNQMNLGIPSASRFADGLRSVFFNAPVPSGCTLIEVLSKDTASILIRTI